MWLKLTDFDGKPLRINMNLVEAYLLFEKGTSIEQKDTAYHVKETVKEIDNAICNPQSELRLVKGAW